MNSEAYKVEINNRNFGRADLSLAPLRGELSIYSIQGEKQPITRSSDIAIINYSAGGLRFLSDLAFPINKSVVLRFKFSVEDQLFNELGVLIWNTASPVVVNHSKSQAIEYGLSFVDMIDSEVQRRVKATFRLQYIIKKFLFRSGPYSHQFDINSALYSMWNQVRRQSD